MRFLLILLTAFVFITTASAKDDTTFMYLEALHYEEKGDYDKAFKIYQQLLKVEPSPSLYLKNSEYLLNKGDADGAYKTIETAIKAFPESVALVFSAGTFAVSQSEVVTDEKEKVRWLNLAKDYYSTSVKLDPSEQNYISLAYTAGQLNDNDTVLDIYTKLIDKGLVEYYMPRGSLLLQMGKTEDGLRDLKKAADSKNVQAMVALAEIYIKEDNTKLATEYLEMAVKLRPDIAILEFYLGRLSAENNDNASALKHFMRAAENMQGAEKYALLEQVAGSYLNNDDYQNAFKAYRLLLDSDNVDAKVYFYAGYTAMHVDPKIAEDIFNEGIAKYPEYTELRKNAAINYIITRKPEKAIEVLIPIDDIEKDVEYYKLITEAYSMANQHDKAIKIYKVAIEENPLNVPLHVGLALEYTTIKKDELAIPLLKKALELEPDSAMIQNFLGYIYADLNINLTDAEKLIDQALGQEPDNYAYIDSKAWVEYRKGNYKKALKLIERAIELSPDDPEVREHAEIIRRAVK